jgi:hypothetical protein
MLVVVDDASHLYWNSDWNKKLLSMKQSVVFLNLLALYSTITKLHWKTGCLNVGSGWWCLTLALKIRLEQEDYTSETRMVSFFCPHRMDDSDMETWCRQPIHVSVYLEGEGTEVLQRLDPLRYRYDIDVRLLVQIWQWQMWPDSNVQYSLPTNAWGHSWLHEARLAFCSKSGL